MMLRKSLPEPQNAPPRVKPALSESVATRETDTTDQFQAVVKRLLDTPPMQTSNEACDEANKAKS